MSKISILLPTRTRTKLVQRSLSQLISKADKPENVEVMIGIDDDDTESLEFFKSAEWEKFKEEYPAVYHVHITERFGYLGLFRYVNYLAEKSTGDHLMFWNDDALMLTDSWDTVIQQHKDYFGLLRMPCVNHRHPFALFPIIPRKWIELFGCVSLVNHSDWWIYNICKPIDRVIDIPVDVYHSRFDVSGQNNDEVFNDNSYALDGRNPNHLDDYSHPQRIQDRQDWILKLKLYGYPHTA